MGLEIKSKNSADAKIGRAKRVVSRNETREELGRKEVLNLEEVALLLCVSTSTIKKMVEEEDFPFRKVGDRWIFGRRAVVAWINQER